MTVKELATIFNQLALDEINKSIPSRLVYFKDKEFTYPILYVGEDKLFIQDVILLEWRKK